VIDQTEALVAIDVNSGRSRSARDSETNAYETNLEAADEICRQLRLRDLGGLIVNDLIDMRFMKHRAAIQERFNENLKRDRAKATALTISDFGILEMTRQRMRPSIRKSHFMACAHCNGRGEIKVPEYVAADAVRHVGFLLQTERVARVELVCSSRVASVLLSGKRRELVRLEDATNKKVDVRVSDAIAVDRVDYYAYDDRNADIDISRLPALTPPTMEQLTAEQDAPHMDATADEDDLRASRQRQRRPGPADATDIALAGEFLDGIDEFEDEAVEDAGGAAVTPAVQVNGEAGAQPSGKRRRRRGRRGRGRGQSQDNALAAQSSSPPPDSSSEGSEVVLEVQAASKDGPPLREIMSNPSGQQAQSAEGSTGRRRRRRRRRGGGETSGQPQANGINSDAGETENPSTIDASETRSGVEALLDLVRGDEFVEASPEAAAAPSSAANGVPSVGPQRKRRRRGRGRAQAPHDTAKTHNGAPSSELGSNSGAGEDSNGGGDTMSQPTNGASIGVEVAPALEGGGRKRRRRRRGQRGSSQGDASNQPETQAVVTSNPNEPAQSQAISAPAESTSTSNSSSAGATAAPKKKRRLLYKAARGPVSPTARQAAQDTE
jgi:ribonuclease E